MSANRWIISASAPETELISKKAGLPLWVARVLTNRGVLSPEDARAFLFGDISSLHNPYLFEDMKKAVARIQKAIINKEKILVFGDYDVDGILSVVMLTRALTDLGGQVEYYIPDRLSQGYGLREQYIESMQSKGFQLLISVDCGIKANAFVNKAGECGLDVIITDHHLPGPQLPAAEAILNPAVPGCGYPEISLAGVGVVFKLMQALIQERGQASHLRSYMKLVAIGTVADVVDLKGENRLLVKFGLEELKNAVNPGLKNLLKICGLTGKSISVGDVGFRIGPRLNAAGRLGKAETAVELFFSEEPQVVENIVSQLDNYNSVRQKIEEKIFNQAVNHIEKKKLHEKHKLLILGCEEWHRGVIGIVSSKIKDLFYRPVILFSYEEGKAVGSGRSIKEFSLIDCLDDNKSFFISYGGHRQAVGCELPVERVDSFRKTINNYVDGKLSPVDLQKKLYIDTTLRFEEMDSNFMELFYCISPFGMGNPRPLFLVEKAEVSAPPQKIKKKHCKLVLRQKGRVFEAIGWQKGAWTDQLKRGDLLDVVFSPQENKFLGQESLYLSLEDIRKSKI
ncbi:MAG: single-stranded-DNA-specific exonuclease RecJ [Acidobacteriota bacterium]